LKTDDGDLVKRFQNGDESRFNLLVQRHREEVYRLAFRFMRNHADADDVAQETFLRAYRSLGRFRGESSFKTWIYRIAVNTAYNYLNSPHASRRAEIEADTPDESVEAEGLRRLEEKDLSRRLKRAVDRLPDRQRQTVILKVYQELKFREIAQVMNCREGTAKANFFHGMRRLKRELEADQADEMF
jgi:RNA polymerase sigma-70 factor (ECF subfamily)